MGVVDPAKGAHFSGRRGHQYARDHQATTHLESYSAYEAFSNISGFSGHGWALMDSATGQVMGEFAWRRDALAAQGDLEAERAFTRRHPEAS